MRIHCLKQDNKEHIIKKSFKIRLQGAEHSLLDEELLIISQKDISSQIIIEVVNNTSSRKNRINYQQQKSPY